MTFLKIYRLHYVNAYKIHSNFALCKLLTLGDGKRMNRCYIFSIVNEIVSVTGNMRNDTHNFL